MDGARGLPPLSGLRAFAVAGRTLNFRMAAERLGVTHGAVAQQVRGLEAQLGVALFRRGSRGLTLTDAGRSYHQAVGRAFDDLTEATRRLAQSRASVTLSVPPTFAAKWLLPRLPAFTANHAEIDLRLLATERLSSFWSDGVDLVVRLTRPPFSAGLRADLLFRQDLVAVCAPNLAPNGTLPVDRDTITKLTLLHDSHDRWPEFFQRHFGGLRESSRPALRFNQTALCIDAALAGQGAALVSRFLVGEHLEAGQLIMLWENALESDQHFFLLGPREARRGASAAVRDWLVTQAAASG